MMRDKTNKYDEGGQNKQGKKAHYDEGGENKAKAHYDEGGEKAKAHYDEGGENKAKTHYDEGGKKTRQRTTMMRVEKTRQRPTITMSMREEKCECGEKEKRHKKKTGNEAKSHRVDRGTKELERFSPLTNMISHFTYTHTHTSHNPRFWKVK